MPVEGRDIRVVQATRYRTFAQSEKLREFSPSSKSQAVLRILRCLMVQTDHKISALGFR